MILGFPLGIALLALAGLIIALHARRKRMIVVPGLLIWRRIQPRSTLARARLRMPPMSLPLLLQLAALAALVLALAQPIVGPNRDVAHWIYLVQGGESSGGRAPDIAKAMERIAGRMDGTIASRHTLIVADDIPRPVFARQRAGDIEPALIGETPGSSGLDTDWPSALAMARQLVRPDEPTHLVVMSGETVPDLPATEGLLEVTNVALPLGEPRRLVDAALAETGEGRWRLSGNILPGEAGPARVSLTFSAEGTAPRVLGETESADGAFALEAEPQAGAGLLTVLAQFPGSATERLDFVVSAGPRRVLHIGQPRAALGLALAAVPGVEMTHAATLPADVTDYALIVIDSVQAGPLPAGNVVLVGSANGAPATMDAPAKVTSWDDTHPLAVDLNWRRLDIRRSAPLPAGATVLARTATGPILSIEDRDTGRIVRLGFQPADSSWADDPALALLATNLVDMLGPRLAGRIAEPCRVGVPCPTDPRHDGDLVVSQADGTALTIARDASGFMPLRAGLYSFADHAEAMPVAVHPLPPMRSAEPAGAPGAAMPDMPIALWPWLAGLGTALLVVELTLALWRHRPQAANRVVAAGDLPRGSVALRLVAITAAVLAMLQLGLPLLRSDVATIAIVADPTEATASGMDAIALAETAEGFARPLDTQLALGAALLPLGEPGRLVVGPLAGRPGQAIQHRLETAGFPIDFVAMPPANLSVDASAKLTAPGLPRAGRDLTVTATIAATNRATGTGRLVAGEETLWTGPVDLTAGANRLDIPVAPRAAGWQELDFELDIDGDAQSLNDRASAALDVSEPRAIAVVARNAAQGDAFARMIAQQGLPATRLPIEDVPRDADGWRDYGAVALIDVPALDVATERQQALDTAVAAQGLGLLILGGPNAFGPGGYLETPLDKLSPISARIPRDRPGVALVFVLDRSSSMREAVGAVTRLDIAKQATLAAIDQLPPESEVAVVTFDSSARVAVPLTAANDTGFIGRMVGQISLGGGTALYRGLTAGFNQLRTTSASARHIVVMTDGQSQPADYGSLVAAMRDAGVTVSSVAIGAQSERDLLEMLAREGGGLFHATTDFAALPSILSQEAMMLASDPVELGTTHPIWQDRSNPVLEGLPDMLPAIEGLVLATAKPDAELHLAVRDGLGEMVPLLASWRYGNGQVMALTTDVLGPWTLEWQRRADYPRLFVNALEAFSTDAVTGTHLTLARRGDDIEAVVVGEQGVPGALAVTDPQGRRIALALRRHARGWTARYRPALAGMHRFAFAGEAGTAEAAIAMDYPERFGVATPSDMRRDSTANGGRLLADWQDATPPPAWRWSVLHLPVAWLGLALLVYLLDLTLRYAGRARALPSAPRPTDRNANA